MKSLAALVAFLLSTAPFLLAQTRAPSGPFHTEIDDTSRFIFYSVLEGCYEDGLSNADVDQILLRANNGNGGRLHFIYACPICGTTVAALETYRVRPENPFNLKFGISTFGSGLPETVKKQLFSPDLHQRLIAVNALVKSWISRRMDKMNLTSDQRRALLVELEKKRKQGMEALKNFRKDSNGPHSLQSFAPGYVDLDECAVCNGAVGELMKLPGAK